MNYITGKILKFNKITLLKFKDKNNLTIDELEKAIVKYIIDDDLILVDTSRLP